MSPSISVIYSFEYKPRFDIEYVNGTFYMLVENRKVVQTFSSVDLKNWTYEGKALICPKPYSRVRRPCILYNDGKFHVWVGGKSEDEKGYYRDTLYFSSSIGFVNMTYGGVALRHRANKNRLLDRSAMITDVWFNETDDKFHAFVGGGMLSAGRWYFVFHATAENPDRFKLNEHLMSAGYCTWAESHLYPPSGTWINGTYHGIIIGCEFLRKPYNHLADLVILESPSELSLETTFSKGDNSTFFEDLGNIHDATIVNTPDGIFAFLARRHLKDIVVMKIED